MAKKTKGNGKGMIDGHKGHQDCEMDDQIYEEEVEEDGELVSFAEWVEHVYDIRTIRNPYDEDTVMVLAIVGNRATMGSIIEMPDGLTPVFHPLMFAEAPVDVDPVTKQIKTIGPQFTKHFMLLQALDWMMLHIDSMYFMQANRPRDMALVEEYEKAVKAIQAQDSNIEIVSEMPSDLHPDNVRPLGRK